MLTNDLFNTDYERRISEGAVDQLEQRRIDDLNMKMDELANRVKSTSNPEHKKSLLKAFLDCKAERDSYYKVANRLEESGMSEVDLLIKEILDGTVDIYTIYSKPKSKVEQYVSNIIRDKVEELSHERPELHQDDDIDRILQIVYDDLDAEYGVTEGIGQDIVNKSEKMARATPPTRAGAVASTVKNAAKWLAGKGGPGREGPTYEGADDIEDRGEYDREGDMAKDNIHTIVRNARELESVIGNDDNLPEWVQDKLANIKGMMTAVSEYMQTQHERDSIVPEGTETQWSKEEPWRKVPKNKSGKAVDPRGEVAHMSDVARRQSALKARGLAKTDDAFRAHLAQKKNSKEVGEDSGRITADSPLTAPQTADSRAQEARKRKQDILKQFAQRGTIPTEFIWASEHDVFMNKDQILDYLDQIVEDPELTALEYMHNNGYSADGLLKGMLSSMAKLGLSKADIFGIFKSARRGNTTAAPGTVSRAAKGLLRSMTSEGAGLNEEEKLLDPEEYGLELPGATVKRIVTSVLAQVDPSVVVKVRSTPEGYYSVSTDNDMFRFDFGVTADGGEIGANIVNAYSSYKGAGIVTNIIGQCFKAMVKKYGRPEKFVISAQEDRGDGVWQHVAQKLGAEYGGSVMEAGERYDARTEAKKAYSFIRDNWMDEVELRKYAGTTRSPQAFFQAVHDYRKKASEDGILTALARAFDSVYTGSNDSPWYAKESKLKEHGGGIGPKQRWQDLMPEGFQDFNKVEPYAVCLAGRPVKKFDYYEEARRFHDNWKKKLYREGDKAKADKITLLPLGLDEGDRFNDPMGYNAATSKAAMMMGYNRFMDVPNSEIDKVHALADKIQKEKHSTRTMHEDDPMGGATVDIGQMAGADADTNPGNLDEDTGSWIVYDPATKQIKKRFKTHTAGKSYAKVHNLGFASSEYYFDKVKDQKSIAEAGDRVDPILIKALNNMPDGLASHGEVLNACYDAYAMELGKMAMKSEYGTTRAYIPQLMDLYKQKHGLTFNEEKTRLDPKCWKGKKIGNPKTKVKGGVRVNNCVPAEESYTKVMESQGVTDPTMLDVARRIDLFAKTIK